MVRGLKNKKLRTEYWIMLARETENVLSPGLFVGVGWTHGKRVEKRRYSYWLGNDSDYAFVLNRLISVPKSNTNMSYEGFVVVLSQI